MKSSNQQKAVPQKGFNSWFQLAIGTPLSGMSFTVPKDILELINPQNGEKFSPNLHAYLSERSDIEFIRLYEDSAKTLWLGYVDGNAFIGTRLGEVLTQGQKARSGAYLHSDIGQLVEHVNFWQNYVQKGRCAIDPNHSMYFLNDQNRISNNLCTWCNKNTH